MLKEIIFYLKKKRFLSAVQYLLSSQMDDNNKELYKTIKFIEKIEKEYKLLKLKNDMYDILFQQIEIKKYELTDIGAEKLKVMIQSNKDLINMARHSFSQEVYDALILQIDYLKIKYELRDWYKEVALVLKEKSILIDSINNKKEIICNELDELEFNSYEYLELKKEYVKLNFDIIKEKSSPILENEISTRNLGLWYEGMINIIKDRILRSNIVILNNQNNLIMNNKNKNIIKIYNDLLIENIKINFYLSKESKFLFANVRDLMVSLINANIEDPLNYMLNKSKIKIDGNNVYKNGIEEKTFEYYLSCFVLKVAKVKGEIRMHLLQLDRSVNDKEINEILESQKDKENA